MDEQRLMRSLRHGPPFKTGYVPATLALDDAPMVRTPVGVGRLVLVIAVTALLLVALMAGLVALGLVHREPRPIANGPIAFARSGSGPQGPNGWVERDIFLVSEGQAAHRIVGSDAESLDQACPAFSPDGKRLAHGEASGTVDTGYHDAALVISDLDGAGNASEVLRIDVGGMEPPPCAAWSADGRRVAFVVGPRTPTYPNRSSAGTEVWVATIADGHVDVLSDLLATDIEWSPAGSQLAIASSQNDLGEGSMRLYDADSGDLRTLVGPGRWGAWSLTWSPDGSRIAYQRGWSDGGQLDQEIWVVEVDGSGEHRIARGFTSIYGVGPAWSPAGDRIVYQRAKGPSTEAHDIVLVTPDGAGEVVLPDLRTPGMDAAAFWRPDGVTWSPDGKDLLYTAWISGRPGRALISRPLDPGAAPVVLYDGLDAGGENRSWGGLPDE